MSRGGIPMTQQCPRCNGTGKNKLTHEYMDGADYYGSARAYAKNESAVCPTCHGTGVVEQTEERFWEAEYKLANNLRITTATDQNPVVEVESTQGNYEPVAEYVVALLAQAHRQGQTEALEGLKNKLAFRFSKSGEYSSREEAKRGWDGHQARMVFEIDEELARLRSQGGE